MGLLRGTARQGLLIGCGWMRLPHYGSGRSSGLGHTGWHADRWPGGKARRWGSSTRWGTERPHPGPHWTTTRRAPWKADRPLWHAPEDCCTCGWWHGTGWYHARRAWKGI